MRSLLFRTVTGAAFLGVIAVGSVDAQGDDNTAFGTTSAEFLLLGAGARGAALGNTFAAIATDPSALYWNPAGPAEMLRPGVTISTYDYLADTRYSWAGIAFPFNDGQSAIGLQIGTFGFTDQPIYTLDTPEGDGTTYGVSETFVGLTFAQNFSDRFAAGITAKFINDQLADVGATGVALDFGTTFHTIVAEKPIRASFVIANLGTTLTHTGVGLDVNVDRTPPAGQTTLPQDPQAGRYTAEEFGLPVVFRIGLAYDFVSSAQTRLTMLGSFSQPNNSDPTGGGGFEWALNDIGQTGFTVMARGSYIYQPDNLLDRTQGSNAGFLSAIETDNGLDGLALGGGIAYARGTFIIGVDYAYRHLGILGGVNVVSATLHW